ncbi:hypothetical protein HZS_7600 [Henneguya salminicola]|nr:hypothetical protein HZS_7600 [Henneguya salminicola]
MKQVDITRKRLKKKASITLSQDHQQTRLRYALLFLSKRDRTFLFLYESGFNLNTSINYGYSDKNVDAVSYKTRKFPSHNWSFQQRKIYNIFAPVLTREHSKVD